MLQIRKILQKVSGLAGLFMLIGVIGAQAAILTVNTTADAGPGSLRQAIIDATVNGEANTVTFNIPTSDPGYVAAEFRFYITLLGVLPNIPLAPMTIDNTMPQGLTVRGNDTFRIFTFVNSAVVTINRLTIRDGFSSSGLGGGIFMGNSSTLFLNLSTVSDNAVAGSGGGIYMSNSSTLHLSRSTISNNTAGDGGGIYIFDSGTLNMDASTVNGNAATNGGGIYNGTNGTINGVNSTINGNTATGLGGGIRNTATITFNHSTFTSNTANQGGGIDNSFTATLLNNLVALNVAAAGTDLSGAYSGTYNLIGNADGSTGVSSLPNRAGTTANPINPVIGPLQNNGGPTFTRALLIGSPALDKASSAALITDQRGLPRPVDDPLIPNDGGNGADMGAYERQFAPTAAGVSVSGRVMTAGGEGIRNARMVLTGGTLIEPVIVTTGTFGYYNFEDLEAGQTYILTVNSKRYTFHTPTRVISLIDNIHDADFIAHARQ